MTQCISLDFSTYSFRTKKLVYTLLTKKANNNNNINNNITCVVTYRAAIAAKKDPRMPDIICEKFRHFSKIEH